MEGFAQLELEVHAGEPLDVRDPGCEVVRVVPGPGLAAVVVVVQVPLDRSDVTLGLKLDLIIFYENVTSIKLTIFNFVADFQNVITCRQVKN